MFALFHTKLCCDHDSEVLASHKNVNANRYSRGLLQLKNWVETLQFSTAPMISHPRKSQILVAYTLAIARPWNRFQ